MSDFFSSAWWLIVALGLLVSFHEFGHFWVARRLGVKVLRFSVGFGSPLWMRRANDGTEYAVGAIPLGGYVKFLDSREQAVPEELMEQTFDGQSVWRRIAIIAAGPMSNLIFAILAFWAMFVFGVPELRPVIGTPTGIAQQAGLEEGQRVLQVNDTEVDTWTRTTVELVSKALDRTPVTVVMQNTDGSTTTHILALDRLPATFDESNALAEIGLNIWEPDSRAVVGGFSSDSAARRSGMLEGDLIVQVNDTTVDGWDELKSAIQKHGSQQDVLEIAAHRDGQQLLFRVMPTVLEEENGEHRFLIGVSSARSAVEILRYAPLPALIRAFEETARMTGATLGMLGRMVSGSASLKNLSGPITIARYAKDSANLGIARFLSFLGILSLSLAILNFLPIPVLDGGHLLYFVIELVRGRQVSEQTQVIGQYLGLGALLFLMVLAFYNDILRLLT